MKRILAVIAVLGLTATAYAGEEEDRVAEVESNLSRIKDNLSSSPSSSSSSSLEEAISNARRVKDAAEKLRNAQNEPGKTMGSYYPGYVDKFQESVRYLKQLKDAQLKQDSDRIWERCYDADRNLRAAAANYLDKKDQPDGRKGITALPDEAERVGRPLGDALKKMEEVHRDNERARSYAKSFSESHQKWSDVKDKLYSATDEIWSKWVQRLEESRQKCGELGKGKDAFIVTDTVAKLSANSKDVEDRYKELRRRYGEWRRDLNAFRQGALQDAREIKELFCNDLDWESRVQAVADKYASDLRSKWDRLAAERVDMLNKVDVLIASNAQNAPKLKRLIVQAWDKVEPVKDGELKGANNPMIRAHIEKGKAEHNSRQGSCNMKESTISSSYCSNPNPRRSDCRLDCVKSCTIIEIKPNNAGEIEMGGKQVSAYQSAFDKMWKDKDGPKVGPKSEMFTMESGRYAHLARCISGSEGSYSFRTETFIETYAFCPGDPAIFFGTREEIPSEDPPERAND